MNNTVILISLSLILPISLLCFYLERRARRIVLSLILGVISGIASYAANSVYLNLFQIEVKYFSVFVAPVVEELLKFTMVLAFGIIVNKGKRGSTANAFSVGAGFCVVENLVYLFSYSDSASIYWIVSRSIGTGLMHCITSAIYGVAVFSARHKSKGKALLVMASFMCGLVFHAVFNTLVQMEYLRIVGILMPITAFFVLFYFIKGSELHEYLLDKNESSDQSH